MKIAEDIKKTYIKSKWILQIIIEFFIIGLFLLFLNYNDLVLTKFSSQLFEIDLPDDIHLIEKYKVRGKLNGNGNGMDFFACILVKTECSQKEINDYINNYKFNPAKNHEIVEIEVIKLHSNRLETKYVENKEIVFKTIKDNDDFNDYYVLSIYDGGYSADFDILGH